MTPRLHRHRGRPDLHSVLELHANDSTSSWPHAFEVRRWAKRHGRHLKERRRHQPPPMIEIALPAGIDVEEAQRICTDALVSLAAGRREGER
ncbi:MAG TPA: hypothetical protein VM537_12900 [Anaerolineae bacterium]|nr:hypothetical protein [Anaerolineae bacterium]